MKELGAYGSSAAFVHKQVLFATSCRALYALDVETGGTLWKFEPQSKDGEWIYSQPAVSRNCVFVGDRTGIFTCLDVHTGRPRWRRQLSRGRNNQVNSTPVISGDTVIAANNEGAVVCYAVATGKTLWRQQIDGGCTGELLKTRDKVIVAGVSLYEINSGTGAVERRHNFLKKRITSVTVSGSRIAAILGTDFHSEPSAWDQPCAFDSEIVLIHRGREVWRKPLSGYRHVRTCRESGFIYAVGSVRMSVIDPSNGSLVKTRACSIGLPSYSKGVLYGLTETGVLFAENIQFRSQGVSPVNRK